MGFFLGQPQDDWDDEPVPPSAEQLRIASLERALEDVRQTLHACVHSLAYPHMLETVARFGPQQPEGVMQGREIFRAHIEAMLKKAVTQISTILNDR